MHHRDAVRALRRILPRARAALPLWTTLNPARPNPPRPTTLAQARNGQPAGLSDEGLRGGPKLFQRTPAGVGSTRQPLPLQRLPCGIYNAYAI